MADMMPLMVEMLNINYERGKKKKKYVYFWEIWFIKTFSLSFVRYTDFTALKEYFRDSKVDLALCDHFTDTCVDAARYLKIPFVVTSTLDLSSGKKKIFLNVRHYSLSLPFFFFFA